MFVSPAFRVYNPESENKDARMARKPGVSNSARKPLADRGINERLPQKGPKSLKPEQAKPKPLEIFATPFRKAEPQKNHPEWLADVCSFKDMGDSYEDIWPKAQRLNTTDAMKFIEPTTPPPKDCVEIDPMFLALPKHDLFADSGIHLEKRLIDDVGVPDFTYPLDLSL